MCCCFFQLVDVVENEAKMAYMRSSGNSAAASDEQRGPSKGFVVREAPWTSGSEKVSYFPTHFKCLWIGQPTELYSSTILFRLLIWAALKIFPALVLQWQQRPHHGDPNAFRHATTDGPKWNQTQSSLFLSPLCPGLTSDPKNLKMLCLWPALATLG